MFNTGIDLQQVITKTLETEAEAILAYARQVDDSIARAAQMIHAHCQAPLIVAGIGKSGHIARKIAATFCSLGKPAIHLHATEASHGDLGIVGRDSVVLTLSNSGETAELSDLLHYCRIHGIATIGLTSARTSTLARMSDIVIAYGRVREACVHGLAPTTSTTLSLAIGDALAVTVSRMMKMTPEDFRRSHPGGSLGGTVKETAAAPVALQMVR
ncbi:SIS domain-containing protein [Rhodobacter sp. CZR27]|uniref:KpsF/GutQ family sugar-phosphate isomerase n=1 Tax=Rhodobacter sp. CZR27 TaxID=2033869 RepID=UPI001E3D466C|nr:SIS domain-containing protein [Rhodobacter sp. CZR27]